MDETTTDRMTVEQAQQALTAAEEAQDAAFGAAEKARVDVEMAKEDLVAARQRARTQTAETNNDETTAFQASFQARLDTWLSEQPDVTQVSDVGLGIFGFVLAGVGDMSLSFNRTGYSPGE